MTGQDADLLASQLPESGILVSRAEAEQLPPEAVFTVDLDQPFGNTGCVIMASGLGKRFGGSKLLEPFRGEPMLRRALDATAAIPHRVVVTRNADAAAYCRSRGVKTILHSLPYRSDTVRLGLEALEGVTHCIFCPADQPLLRQESVYALALLGVQEDRILRLSHNQEPGTPMLFPCRFFPELRSLPQGKGGGVLAKKYPEQVGLVPVRDAYELMDVDTPEDLRRLLEQ